MSYSFPKNQEDGTEIELENGATYIYNAAKKSWEVISAGVALTNDLFTLSSAGNTFYWDPYPNTNQFSTADMSMNVNNLYHLYNLKDDRGANVYVKDYLSTPDTVWEIWAGSSIRVRTPIKNWATSRKGSNYIEFNVSGSLPTIAASDQFRTNYPYQLILTNLRKKL